MWNLLIFALLGLLVGAGARLLYPGRQPVRILGTLVLGAIGAVVGGLISWSQWPAVDDQFHSGNLILSFLGATIAIAACAGLAYARSVSGPRRTSI